MKRILLPLLMAFAATAAFAQEAVKPLTIGDPAPEFKVDGFIKGEKVSKLEKGKAYVIEFWATWCGPCIAVFPHLSELTEKYEGQITTVSVNTWDYRGDADKDAHIKKIDEFLVKHGDNMRYNIVLDDDKDTIAKTWMTAAGRNGIPCAFIVNEEGLIAWIGHPAAMDKPLEAIVNKTWDLQAFKTTFEKEASAAREAAKKQAEMTAKVKEYAKNNDLEGFDSMVKEMGAQAVIAAVNTDPNFAVKVMEKYAGKLEDMTHTTVCSISAYLAGQKSLTDENKESILKVSANCMNATDEKNAALSVAYHARALFAAGKKDEAKTMIEKASDLVAKYEPEANRNSIQKFIDDSKKMIEAAN